MKKQTGLFLTVAVSMVIFSSKATIFWYGDPSLSTYQVFGTFDTHGYTNGACADNPNNTPICNHVLDPIFNRNVWHIHKPVERKRAEVAGTDGTVNSFVPVAGEEIYIGYHWRMSNSPSLNAGLIVFQWKSIGRNLQDYPFKVQYDGSNLSMSCTGPKYNGGVDTGSVSGFTTTIWQHPLSAAAAATNWCGLVYHVKISPNPAVGFIEVYYNGQLQTLMNSNPDTASTGVILTNNNTRAMCCTWDISGNDCKWGAYDGVACNYVSDVFYDHMRITTTLNEALPGNW